MNTLTSADRHAVGMSTGVRRLTPIECERLQGFPDDWTDGQADSHRYKQMGNAVTVNVIQWIGARL
jgi:DNA (cytosine-5)-methyltransferase 1